jgi:rubrerythrin
MKSDLENDLLLNLYKHDVAACDVYKEVLPHIEDSEIKERITEFLHDHQEHVKNLENAYRNITGELPPRGIDVKGTVLFGYTSIRSMTGQVGALKALQTTEKVLLKRYQGAAEEGKNCSPEVIKIINKGINDENKHNEYVDYHLSA